MKHRARVLRVASDTVLVEVEGVSGCQRCAKGRGCGAGIFAQGTRSIQLECATRERVEENQQVTIEVDDAGSRWLWLVAGAYGLPTLGLLGATLAATFLLPDAHEAGSTIYSQSANWREALVAVSALFGLSGGVFAWRYLSPGTIARLEKGLCLQSARIVAVDNLSVGEI